MPSGWPEPHLYAAGRMPSRWPMKALKFEYPEHVSHQVCMQTFRTIDDIYVYQQVSSVINSQLHHQVRRQLVEEIQ